MRSNIAAGFGFNAGPSTAHRADGNSRVEKLARSFGAERISEREGPPWMKARGWRAVDWAIRREVWHQTKQRFDRASCAASGGGARSTQRTIDSRAIRTPTLAAKLSPWIATPGSEYQILTTGP